ETVLDVLRERGRRGLPCTELYRQLFNPGLYLMAYGRIYANHGAMTSGVDGDAAGHRVGRGPAARGGTDLTRGNQVFIQTYLHDNRDCISGRRPAPAAVERTRTRAAGA